MLFGFEWFIDVSEINIEISNILTIYKKTKYLVSIVSFKKCKIHIVSDIHWDTLMCLETFFKYLAYPWLWLLMIKYTYYYGEKHS